MNFLTSFPLAQQMIFVPILLIVIAIAIILITLRIKVGTLKNKQDYDTESLSTSISRYRLIAKSLANMKQNLVSVLVIVIPTYWIHFNTDIDLSDLWTSHFNTIITVIVLTFVISMVALLLLKNPLTLQRVAQARYRSSSGGGVRYVFDLPYNVYVSDTAKILSTIINFGIVIYIVVQANNSGLFYG